MHCSNSCVVEVGRSLQRKSSHKSHIESITASEIGVTTVGYSKNGRIVICRITACPYKVFSSAAHTKKPECLWEDDRTSFCSSFFCSTLRKLTRATTVETVCKEMPKISSCSVENQRLKPWTHLIGDHPIVHSFWFGPKIECVSMVFQYAVFRS